MANKYNNTCKRNGCLSLHFITLRERLPAVAAAKRMVAKESDLKKE